MLFIHKKLKESPPAHMLYKPIHIWITVHFIIMALITSENWYYT